MSPENSRVPTSAKTFAQSRDWILEAGLRVCVGCLFLRWGVRVRPFGALARGMSSVRYGTRLGDLEENWFLCFPIKHSTHTREFSTGVRGGAVA